MEHSGVARGGPWGARAPPPPCQLSKLSLSVAKAYIHRYTSQQHASAPNEQTTTFYRISALSVVLVIFRVGNDRRKADYKAES